MLWLKLKTMKIPSRVKILRLKKTLMEGMVMVS